MFLLIVSKVIHRIVLDAMAILLPEWWDLTLMRYGLAFADQRAKRRKMMSSNGPMDINDTRTGMIEEDAGPTLLGRLIDASSAQADGLDRGLWDTHLPIQLCLCVHDSSTNPCHCIGPILWIPRVAILQSSPVVRYSEDGRVIDRVIVRRKTELVVDVASSVSVGRFLGDQSVRSEQNSAAICLFQRNGVTH